MLYGDNNEDNCDADADGDEVDIFATNDVSKPGQHDTPPKESITSEFIDLIREPEHSYWTMRRMKPRHVFEVGNSALTKLAFNLENEFFA